MLVFKDIDHFNSLIEEYIKDNLNIKVVVSKDQEYSQDNQLSIQVTTRLYLKDKLISDDCDLTLL